MVVQSMQTFELSWTEVAFVAMTIPRQLRGNRLDVLVTWHGDHGLGDDVVPVETSDHAVNLLAIETGGATAGLKVDCETGRGGVGVLTPWAGDVAPLVNSGVQVLKRRNQHGKSNEGSADANLHQVVVVMKETFARVTIGMTAIDIVLATSLLGLEFLIADLALPIVTSRSVSIAVVEVLLQS